jgi:hypothetical protein
MQINSQRNPYSANQKMGFGCKFDEAGKVVELCPRAQKVVDSACNYYLTGLGHMAEVVRNEMMPAINSRVVEVTKNFIEKDKLQVNKKLAASAVKSPLSEIIMEAAHGSILDMMHNSFKKI